MAAATASARRQALHDFKRGVILDAARRVAAAHGLDGATIRAIAAQAGYTPGAIYAYYGGKEEIYGDLLADSLAAATQAMKAAGALPGGAAARLWAVIEAFRDHYRSRPQELDLALYLLAAAPSGLGPELARHINGRLIALLQVLAGAVGALGEAPHEAVHRDTVTLFGTLLGMLLLERSGRLALLGFEAEALLGRYVDALAARLREQTEGVDT